MGHLVLDVGFKQDETQDTDRNRFENRAMFNKLSMSLVRLMQAHPDYRGYSVADIRSVMAMSPRRHFGRMLEIVGRDAFDETVGALRLTDADRRRYERALAEAEGEILA